MVYLFVNKFFVKIVRCVYVCKKKMLIVYLRFFFGLRKIIFFLGLICEVVWNEGYNDFCNKGDNYCK